MQVEPLRSYAEGGLDLAIWQRFFSGRPTGVVVEVGAARPDYLSMSALFRDRGWRAILIDPNPAYAPLHAAAGQELLLYACSDRDEDDVDFQVVNSHQTAYRGGEVTFESFSALSIKPKYADLKQDLDASTIKVKVRRLDTILEDQGVVEIDVLNVDVEGWELEVLRGLSFERYQPKVLVIENLFKERAYRSFMRERGYRRWKHLPPNEVWVRRDLLPRWPF
jgi:FkbM family methyltransferase